MIRRAYIIPDKILFHYSVITDSYIPTEDTLKSRPNLIPLRPHPNLPTTSS
jgi:hypothetical protein